MVNLKTRISDLKKQTGSLEVKEICEKAYARLSEINEMRITRSASDELENSINESLLKDLSNIKDKSTQKFLESETRLYTIKNLGVKSGLKKINESDAIKHPALSYALTRFNEIASKPEYLIAETFYNTLAPFNWHPVVQESLSELKANGTKYKEDIIIHKSVFELKNSRSSYILSAVNESLDNYLSERTKATKSVLMEKLSKFNFDPLVRSLANAIRESVDTSLVIKTSGKGTVISDVYSPIIVNENHQIFAIGTDVYKLQEGKVSRLGNTEVSKLNESFIRMVNLFNTKNVKVNENEVTYYKGDRKIKVNEDGIFVNETAVTNVNFAKTYVNNIFNKGEQHMLESVLNVSENFADIVKVDFAKRFTSPFLGERRADVIKLDETLYVAKNDPAMGKNEFFSDLNATQTRSLVLEFLNFDIYESFSELIEQDDAKLMAIEESKESYVSTISELETKLNDIANVSEDIKSSNEYKQIVEILENEINSLKSEYSVFVANAYELTTIPNSVNEGDEPEAAIADVSGISVTDKVICIKHDAKGTVTAIDEVTGVIFVLLDDGETIECGPDALEVIDAIGESDEVEVNINVNGKDVTSDEDEDEDEDDVKKDEDEDEDEDDVKKDEDEDEDDLDLSLESHHVDGNTQIAEFTAGDRVESKSGEYGTVQGVDETSGEITVLHDDGKTDVWLDSDLTIVDELGVNESVGAGDEVELEDGTRGMVQGENGPAGEIIVVCDNGETKMLSSSELKIVSKKSKGVDEDVTGAQGTEDGVSYEG